jgi:acetylornithine deacetylase/succinyl-diaminopimelate desuccinylase-like protein
MRSISLHPRNVVELLQELVAISSVNPQGLPGTDHTGELAIANYAADFLRQAGAHVTLEEVLPGRPNVIADFLPASPKAHLSFAPHLDTVSVLGMTIPPFDPIVRDGKLFGRGATDTKGPMAAALWALCEWARSPARKSSSIQWSFLGLANEEAGNTGAQALAARHYSSDLMLVLEPTEMRVVNAQKGILWFEIVTHGRACHGSTPELGRNAIEAMGDVLNVIKHEIIPHLARDPHPILGPTTLNVGTIQGGSKINIVPDFCRIEVDCRFIPALTLKTSHALIESRVREAVPEAVVTIQRCSPPLNTETSLPWVARLGNEAGGFASAAWYADAGILNAPHCPAVCIGPGHIAQAHTRDEFISVAVLEQGAAFFRRWIDVAEDAARASSP